MWGDFKLKKICISDLKNIYLVSIYLAVLCLSCACGIFSFGMQTLCCGL